MCATRKTIRPPEFVIWISGGAARNREEAVAEESSPGRCPRGRGFLAATPSSPGGVRVREIRVATAEQDGVSHSQRLQLLYGVKAERTCLVCILGPISDMVLGTELTDSIAPQ